MLRQVNLCDLLPVGCLGSLLLNILRVQSSQVLMVKTSSQGRYCGTVTRVEVTS